MHLSELTLFAFGKGSMAINIVLGMWHLTEVSVPVSHPNPCISLVLSLFTNRKWVVDGSSASSATSQKDLGRCLAPLFVAFFRM